MEFWRDGLVIDLLAIAVLLGLTNFLRARLSWMRKLAVPDALVAGTFGVVLGPEILGVIPFDFARLEFLVYHGFAIVFVAVGLQSPPTAQQRGGSARSFAVALSSIGVLQVLIGFALLIAIAAAVGLELHPAFGFMPLLGFHQGPGPALALGSAWEPLGLVSGAGLGLVFAAFGFASCVFLGVPLVWLGRRAGWVTPRAELEVAEPELPSHTQPRAPAIFEPLRTQVIAIGCVYAAVFGLLWTLTSALPAGSGLAATLWGFNFIAGALLAIGLRRSARRLRVELPLDDPMLSRIAVVAVDFTTAAALAAVRMSILDRWLAPIVLLAAVTAIASLVVSIWLARRAFPSAPFEHAVALFGATTGTVPTALALLRGQPHHVGAYVAAYNEVTLKVLAEGGATRLCIGPDLGFADIRSLAAAAVPGIALEVTAFGRLPLAISARCYHARAHGLRKDGCQFVCDRDPDGMPVDSIDGDPFLTVNGVQVLSGSHASLMPQLPALCEAGIGRFRLTPHSGDMVAVAELFRTVLDGHVGPEEGQRQVADLFPTARFANGFFHGGAGKFWIDGVLPVAVE